MRRRGRSLARSGFLVTRQVAYFCIQEPDKDRQVKEQLFTDDIM